MRTCSPKRRLTLPPKGWKPAEPEPRAPLALCGEEAGGFLMRGMAGAVAAAAAVALAWGYRIRREVAGTGARSEIYR